METSRAYLFDHYMATLQVGMVRDVPHRHAAYQVTLSLDGRPHMVGASAAGGRPGLIHLVGSNVPHTLDGNGGEQLLLWLAPETQLGRRLAHTYLRELPMTPLSAEPLEAPKLAELSARMHAGAPADEVRQRVEELLSALARFTVQPPVAAHPAVRKALRIIRALDTANISADELASQVGLSNGRLLHVFKDEMGIPLRPYLQWLRCIDVLVLLSEGRSVTEAALAAGFTDGAHCNRVLKKYVCLSPSALAATDMRVRRSLAAAPD